MTAILDQKPWQIDPSVTYCPWRPLTTTIDHTNTSKKLNFLILPTDLITVSLPPIASLLQQTEQRLKAAGHNVTIMSNPPQIIETTQRIANGLLGADGGSFTMGLLSSTQETKVPWIESRLKNNPPKTLQQLFALGVKRLEVQKELLSALWKDETVDAIIMPVFPHPVTRHDEFNSANFTMMWNMLDWPAVAIPTGEVSEEDIKKQLTETKAISSWDEANRKLC